jgi:ribosome biogenesis GTPase
VAADRERNHSGETGLVVAAFGRRGRLETAGGEQLPFLVANRRLAVVCGDRVRWEQAPAGDAVVVTGVEPRRCELQRQPPNHPRPEVLAANVSHLVVVTAPRPEPDPFLVDRYLCAAALMDCRAAIVWNKADLGVPLPGEAAVWSGLGYPVLPVSARDGTGLSALEAWLEDGVAILVGQSGTGKSSLLNALVPEAEAQTGGLSAGSGEGRHTTTASVLLSRPGGGRIIDTPGVRDFVPAVPDTREVAVGFIEISALAPRCRFADCSHLREPGCAVLEALGSGRVDPRRHESYRRMMTLAAQAAERRRP